MTFGTILRKNREKKRLSQKEVAEHIGIAQATYHNWETEQSSFRVEYLPKLAEVFDVAMGDLMPEGTTLKLMNNQHQKNHDRSVVGFDVTINESRELYTELVNSKDEIIRLLKEENTLLKVRNAQLDENQKRDA
ncbi:helix-turn-helix domain-containing protein [Spirosoma linguale]|uniref:Transcriptional regulator, XRE family n=1 Tax=Spirosoma linguale (strain ATCC 33905 / DSM 74 / LMG 10896 / Claus 1) TaxID=504472 RepID=D2QPU1_SPILD|nr:transcriptional regulator, XRE family [Spirosoma linguale DSM 74]